MSMIEPRDVRLRDGTTAVIRAAREEDAEDLVALCREVAAEGPWTLAEGDEKKLTAAGEAKEIDRLNGHTGSVYLVACDDSRVIGTARAEGGAYRRTAHFADVHSVWVHRTRRCLGVADGLMRALVNWAHASEQIEKLGLFAFSTSEAAISLYKKHGFVCEGRGVRDMKFEDGSYADTVILGHFLGAEEKTST